MISAMNAKNQFPRYSAITRDLAASMFASPAGGCRWATPSPCSLLAATIVIALTANVGSALATYPHTLSYFNEVVGGPLNGPAHLLDANIDWGQEILQLNLWLTLQSSRDPLFLALTHAFDPRIAGIHFTPIPTNGATDVALGRSLPAGWYAISASSLRHALHKHRYDSRTAAQARAPCARAGYAIAIFEINADVDAHKCDRRHADVQP